jgi:16S rRNA (guanine966-N2)-methyltransferase
MRVIAGRFKGRRLKVPTWDGLRPTSDKLRETLFNILAPRVPGARVLDGYAGTGAVGIEALSRGAAHVTFVDSDRRATALIAQNVALCGIDRDYTIARLAVESALRRLPADDLLDIIVLDPPYEATGIGDVLEAAAGHLAPSGILVLERATRREPEPAGALTRVRDVKSGDSSLTFYTMAS